MRSAPSLRPLAPQPPRPSGSSARCASSVPVLSPVRTLPRIAAVFALGAVSTLLGCSGSSSTPDEPAKPATAEAKPAEAAPVKAIPKRSKKDTPSVVLITMDTTRADHIGAYGYDKAMSPTVDAFAANGLRFERAYSVVPLTTPSHASMMTGLYPTRHGIHNNGDAILSDDFTTLAEALHDEGYATAAAISAFVTTRVWNLDQGFDDYYDDVKADRDQQKRGRWAQERPADLVVDDLIGWIDAHKAEDKPFFLWAHFYDPHDPYAPPREWLQKAENRPYDGEIGFMDAQIARLKEAVEANDGDAGSAWVLIADHGEALEREHGEHTHGMYLYDTTMRIPFIVKPPKGLAEPVVESENTVSNADVTPTILGMLGYDVPEDLDGTDLSVFLGDKRLARDPVYMEAESARNRFGFAPERAMAHGPLKLMDTPNPRLFDVVADPGETTNLVADKPDDVARLQKAHEAIQARRKDADGMGASPEVIAQLEALGYVAGSDDIGDEESAKLDAKDQKQLIGKLDRARMLTRRGKVKKAIALYEQVIAEHEQISEARMNLAKAYARVGRRDEAVATLEKAIELDPNSTVLRSNLAGMFAQQGKTDKALELFESILIQVPNDDVARTGIARLLLGSGRLEDAERRVKAWATSEPQNREWDAQLGLIYARMNRVAEAVPLLERSLTDDMPRMEVHSTLAAIAHYSGDDRAALYHLEAESDWFPTNLPVRMKIGSLHMGAQKWEEASAEYQYVAEARPRDPLSRRMWAQAVFNTGDYPGAGKILEPALAVAPDDADVLLLQANILKKLGKEAEADATFAQAKKLHEARMAAQRAQAAEANPDPLGLGGYENLDQYGIPE